MAVRKISESAKVYKKINLQSPDKLSSGRLHSGKLHLGLSGYAQLLLYSFLFSYPSFSCAGPVGGNIVGGVGHIHASGLTTNIHQNSAALAINWDSYNLSASEVVNYLQPDASSIALNRITGNSGSQILGQINANGQVVLVNPNGVFFGATASVNVGGLIASGLDIKPIDFMNGDYVFRSIDGTRGAVINGGILNASLGGSIALIGQQVTNEGLISANLGAVNLAAGKEAILTFDSEGLMGVKITRAVLQDELGVDPAILNRGEITAQSGRVLLTASQSQDIFSQAVNSNGIEQATSVVVNADGSFTLGGGADVVNTGTVDVSADISADVSVDASATGGDGGQIVVLGENITSSGILKADSATGNGGDIELHATQTTLLTENSSTSARSENNGQGGGIKVLGNKVGLFDQSTVDVSGANGGGEVLIGGDFQGKNTAIRNAQRTAVSLETTIFADALDSGNGGKVILWADDTSLFKGSIYTRGGSLAGNGGFIEVSGKRQLGFFGNTDRSAVNGLYGTLLLDPNNIDIVALAPGTGDGFLDDGQFLLAEGGTNADFTIAASTIVSELDGGDVSLQANGDIFLSTTIDARGNTNAFGLTLTANVQIDLDNGSDIFTKSGGFITLDGNVRLNGGGKNNTLSTGIDGGDITFNNNITSSDDHNSLVLIAGTGTVDLKGDYGTSGNEIGGFFINSAGIVNLNNVFTGGGHTVPDNPNGVAGEVNIIANTINLAGDITTNNSTHGANITREAGDVTLDGDVVLNGDVQIDSSDDTSGFILITGNVIADTNADIRTLELISGSNNTTVSGDIGAGTDNALQSFTITRAKDVAVKAITTQDGGVSIDANQITVGGIDTTGGATPGAVSITATELTGPSVAPSITLNGDINGGANPAQLSLVSTTTGSVTINYVGGDFTGQVNVTGSAGADTIKAAARLNTWEINAADAGDLNATLRFINFETLAGGTLNDDFNFSGAGTAGTVTGGGGANTVKGKDGIDNAWQLTGANAGNVADATNAANPVVYLTSFSDIQTLTGGALTDTLIGLNNDNTWNVAGASAAGSVQDTSNGSGNIAFINMENLLGGNLVDLFNLQLTASVSGVNGGGGADTFNVTDTAINVAIDGGDAISADTLVASARNNTWTVDGSGAQTVTDTDGAAGTVTFDNIENLTGGSLNDDFNFSATGSAAVVAGGGGAINTIKGKDISTGWVSGGANAGRVDDITLPAAPVAYVSFFSDIQVLAGGTGADTLTGRTVNSTWRIDNVNAGNVAQSIASPTDTLAFSGMENLTGNAGADDAFVFSGAGALLGVIEGGTGGADSITLNTVDGALNTWAITGPESGRLVGVINTGDATNALDGFSGIEGVRGSDDADTFVIENASFLGNINGGNDDNVIIDPNDTVDFSGLGTAPLSVQLGSQGFTNIEVLGGNNVSSTLIGAAANTWDITGVNAGTINNTLRFTGFNNLTGGSGTDTFNIQDNGTGRGDITGLIDGAGGTNTLNIFTPANLSGTGSGAAAIVQLDGVAGAAANANNVLDVINISQITANGAFNNEIRAGIAGTNNWRVDGDRTGTVNTNTRFTNFATLTGADGRVDNFTIAATALSAMTLNGGSSANVGEFDTLQGANLDGIWTVSGEDIGTVTDNPVVPGVALSFNGIETLRGGTGADDFVLAGGTLRGTVDGGAGADSLRGNTGTNNWDITALNEGSVEGVDTANSTAAYGFTGIESLTGNSGTDNFVLTGGTLDGTIDGGAGNDTLTGGAGTSNWDITALNEGNVEGIDNLASNAAYDFSGIESLTGNVGTDNFVLNGGTLSGTINGGAGEDSLTGGDVVNTWTINDVNQGDVTGVDIANANGAYDFIDIENISGGILDDAFSFESIGVISGVVDGGAESRNINGDLIAQGDTLDMSGVAVVDLVVGATPLSAVGMNIVSIEEVTGNGANSKLTGEAVTVGNTLNSWVIFDSNGGTVVNDGTVENENGLLAFFNFSALQGSDRDDLFAQRVPGALSMSIDGGTQQVADQLDFSQQSGAVVVDLNASVATSITDIEGVKGNDTNSTLIARDGRTNAWIIDGNNDGSVNLGVVNESMIFTDFNILVGGNGVDNFIVQNNGSTGNQTAPEADPVSGIRGGAGADTLTALFTNATETNSVIRFDGGNGDDQVRIGLNGNQNGAFTLNSATPNGGSGDDTLTLQGTGVNYIETYTPDVGGFDQLVYANGASAYTVNYANINNGTVNDNVSAESLGINGSASANAADTIVLNTADFQVNTNTRVNYANKRNLLVDGLGGADIININSALNFAGGRVELTAQSIVNAAGNGFEIMADDLLLDTSTSIGSGTAVIGDAGNALRTNVVNLSLVGVDGSAYIGERSALNINELSNNNGTLNISAGGTVSSTVDLQSAANIDINAGGGDVLLSSVNNLFSGELSFSGNVVTLNNTVVTRLNNITATTFNASTTSGSLIDINTGGVQVTGLSTLNAPFILMDGPNLNLSGLEVNNSNVVLVNNSTNALNVTSINATGLVDISAGVFVATGDISASGITLRTGAATVNTLNATNDVTVESGGFVANGDIISGATFINANAGDVSVNGITANTGGVSVSGNDITQAGNVVSEGDTVFNAAGIFNMVAGSTATVNTGAFTVTADGVVNLQAVTAASDIGVRSNVGTINVLEDMNTAQGRVEAIAGRNVLINGDITSLLGISLETLINGDIIQNGGLNSAQGDITAVSVQAIVMGSNASSTATAGNIQYNAENNVGVGNLSAASGKIGIISNVGAVDDANGVAMNVVADILEIRSDSGVGTNDQLETQVAMMDVINTGSGEVNFQQTGDVDLLALKNTGDVGNINLISDQDIRFNPGSVDANRAVGFVFMRTTSGDFAGLLLADLGNPDITAQNATFLASAGTFGTLTRPITMDVPGSVLIDSSRLFDPRFVPPGPSQLSTTGFNVSLAGVVAAVASEQLVEIETLAEIDPAIFTDLQNYSSEETSIKMPQDQLFEDELEVADRTEF